MSPAGLIGIFGGTFDPIHNGHIQSVESLLKELEFKRIYLLPSSTPPHRQPTSTSAKDRLKMVSLAVADNEKLTADDREARQSGKSYTIDTLKSFRQEFSHRSIAFIVGMDAYLNMPEWKQWEQFLDYAHIIVMKRPGYHLTSQSWGEEFKTGSEMRLTQMKLGHVYFADSNLIDISSTQIRERLAAGLSVQTLLSASVINYIKRKQLYAHT